MLEARKHHIGELVAGNVGNKYHEVSEDEAWRVDFLKEIVEIKHGELQGLQQKSCLTLKNSFAHSDGASSSLLAGFYPAQDTLPGNGFHSKTDVFLLQYS